MDNEIFSWLPIEANLDRRLHHEHLRVLIALFSFRGKNSDTVWPSRESISRRTGMHITNISKATAALVEFGWLTKTGNGGCSKATRYTITTPRHLIDFVNENVCQRKETTVAQEATRPVAHKAMPGVAQEATGIELTNELTNESNTRKREKKDYSQQFADFWKLYPNKTNKANSQKAFEKLNPDEQLIDTMKKSLEAFKRTRQWQDNNGQYVPNMQAWINGKRWLDELETTQGTASGAFAGAI